MVYTIRLDDRVIPYHPLEHRDTIHISNKRYYSPLLYPLNIQNLNQARAHLLEKVHIHLSNNPKPNLPVKCVQLPIIFSEGR